MDVFLRQEGHISADDLFERVHRESPGIGDEKGFIVTGQELVQRKKWGQSRPPFFLETSCPGVFAAGDARAGSVKRVASSVGEGSMAVAFIHQYLSL